MSPKGNRDNIFRKKDIMITFAQRMVTMPVLRRSFFRRIAPLGACVRGLSVLDVVIAVLVLTIVLLAATNQFGSYEQSTAPVSAEQPADQAAAEQ